MNDSGLLKAGYDYFVIDGGHPCDIVNRDCWMAHQRSKSGDLVPNKKRFPSGIKALADEVHALGMKFGIYESAGYYTCQGYPGSLGTTRS